jgi:hypothetical protein
MKGYGWGGGDYWGISTEGVAFNNIISNNVIDYSGFTNETDGIPIRLYGHGGYNIVSGNTIIGNPSVNAPFVAIYTTTSHNLIKDNIITDGCWWRAIWVDEVEDNYGNYSRIIGNTITQTYAWSTAIYCEDVEYVEITGNRITMAGTATPFNYTGATNTIWGFGNIINNKPCENFVTSMNVTTTTFIFNPNCAGIVTWISPMFNTTAISGWSATFISNQVTITVTGTSLPKYIQCICWCIYKP